MLEPPSPRATPVLGPLRYPANGSCPKQCWHQPHSRKHLLFPSVLPMWSVAVLHLAGHGSAGSSCWAKWHCSLQRERNGYWKMGGEREIISWQESHQSILSTMLVLSVCQSSQPALPTRILPLETSEQWDFSQPWFFCMDKYDSWPPGSLFVHAEHVLCHFPGHNQLCVQMQSWKTRGSLSSKLQILLSC